MHSHTVTRRRASVHRFGWKNTRIPARRRGDRLCGVWESSQVTGLPNNARFRCRRGRLFFSFLLFYFFSEPRSIVQLSPRSYAHAFRVFHHPRFIATFARVNILFLFRFSVLYVKICFSVARTMLIWWCVISSLNLLLLLLLSLLPLLS